MSKPMLVVAEGSPSSTDCARAAAMAAAELAAALLVDGRASVPAPDQVVLADADAQAAFRPEQAPEPDPAGLKWGGPTGRKDEA